MKRTNAAGVVAGGGVVTSGVARGPVVGAVGGADFGGSIVDVVDLADVALVAADDGGAAVRSITSPDVRTPEVHAASASATPSPIAARTPLPQSYMRRVLQVGQQALIARSPTL